MFQSLVGFLHTQVLAVTMSEYFGPALPPELTETDSCNTPQTESSTKTKQRGHKKEKKHKQEKKLHRKSSSSASSDSSSSDSSSDSDTSDSDGEKQAKKSYSSSSNAHESDKPTAAKYIGPMLPPEVRESNASAHDQESPENSSMIGPVMPAGFLPQSQEESEDEDLIGPMPSEAGDSNIHTAAMEIEQRARKMRDKLDHASDETVQTRESWMLELPPQLGANIGLGARKFKLRQDDGNDDRSSWTDTPADKERKLKEGNEGGSKKRPADDSPFVKQRDQQFSSQISQYNEAKRPKSLLEMHEEKLHGKKKKPKKEKKGKKEKKKDKKKKKHKEKEKEKAKTKVKAKEPRRPFDRDLDLQVNRFDEAQRRSLVKRSQELNSRFSAGKTTSQFL